jgi:uncharacterized protein (TIGR02246 family)
VDPIELTDRYVAAVRARDIEAFIALFEPDAVFVTPDGRENAGAPAIREMELAVFAAATPPTPTPSARFVGAGGVAMEIDISLPGGRSLRMASFFHLSSRGLIQRLSVYRQG